MDKALTFNKRVGPNKHVGGIFSKTLMKVQLGCVWKSTKNTIRHKKLELKIEKSQFKIN